MNISNYLEEQLIRHTLGLGSFSPSSPLFLMLCDDISDDGDTYTELSGTNYARYEIDPSTDISAVSDGAIVNTQNIIFNTANSQWGIAKYIAVISSGTIGSGNIYFWSELNQAKFIDISAIFRILTGELDISLSGAFGLYLRNNILDWIFHGNALSSPAGIWVGVGTNIGGQNASMSEPVAGYNRISIPFGDFTQTANGQYSIDQLLLFTASGANWGTLTHVGLFDAATNGNLLYALQLSPSRHIFDGDGIQFDSGSIVLRLS